MKSTAEGENEEQEEVVIEPEVDGQGEDEPGHRAPGAGVKHRRDSFPCLNTCLGSIRVPVRTPLFAFKSMRQCEASQVNLVQPAIVQAATLSSDIIIAFCAAKSPGPFT
jgi:hypothetical protein